MRKPRKKKLPAVQGEKSYEVGNCRPPLETQFKPGQSGNPAGRPPALGSSVIEWANQLGHQGLSEDALRVIARDKAEPFPKRAAALRCLRLIEAADLSDFSAVLRGDQSLEELRAAGTNTEVVKKIKQRTRKINVGDGKFEDEIEREIELYDRSGSDFDRLLDRTIGKPTQAVELTGKDGGSLEINHAVDLSKLSADELRTWRELRIKASAGTNN